MNFRTSPPPPSFRPQPRRVTSMAERCYATPNGHNLSDTHVQSILILLSETQAPSHCSAIQSHVTCFSLIASLTCQISLASSWKIAEQSEAYLWHSASARQQRAGITRIKALIFQMCEFGRRWPGLDCSARA